MKASKRIIGVLVIAGSLLALGSDSGSLRQTLVGDRVMTISTSETNALVSIEDKPLVEVRSDTSNHVTVVVYGGKGECLVASFINDESEPYQVHRTIRDDRGATAIIYGPDGSETARKFFPRE